MHGRVPGIRFSDCYIIRYLFKSTDTADNRGCVDEDTQAQGCQWMGRGHDVGCCFSKVLPK